MRVAILGGGILGACTALAAQREGHAVTLIEPARPGREQAASFGNACWLSPASVVPPALPGLWRKLPRLLLDPLGPLSIRWGRLPGAASWLLRYLASGWTEARVQRTAHALRPLLEDAPALHAELAARAGAGRLIERRGLLYAYPSRAAFTAEALAWRVRAAAGVRWLELDAPAMRAQAPELDPRYGFGILVEEGGHCLDPGALVMALVALAEAQGMARIRARATGFVLDGARLRAIRTDGGEIPAEAAVVCAGIHSKALAAEAGDRIPLESERGYHVVLAAPEAEPRIPIMPSDGKMGVTLTDGGLRAAGQVEIAGLSGAPDWRRAVILRDKLLRLFPALPRDLPAGRISYWMGHRPSTPDGLPVLGPSRASPDILYGFGHGHVGLAAAPRSALLLADLLAGRTPSLPMAEYSPARFR